MAAENKNVPDDIRIRDWLSHDWNDGARPTHLVSVTRVLRTQVEVDPDTISRPSAVQIHAHESDIRTRTLLERVRESVYEIEAIVTKEPDDPKALERAIRALDDARVRIERQLSDRALDETLIHSPPPSVVCETDDVARLSATGMDAASDREWMSG